MQLPAPSGPHKRERNTGTHDPRGGSSEGIQRKGAFVTGVEGTPDSRRQFKWGLHNHNIVVTSTQKAADGAGGGSYR